MDATGPSTEPLYAHTKMLYVVKALKPVSVHEHAPPCITTCAPVLDVRASTHVTLKPVYGPPMGGVKNDTSISDEDAAFALRPDT